MAIELEEEKLVNQKQQELTESNQETEHKKVVRNTYDLRGCEQDKELIELNQELNENLNEDLTENIENKKEINFNELVKNNNTKLSLNVQTKMIDLLTEQFTEEEQKWHVANLYVYMNYHPTNDYPINLEHVFKMIGFAHKENAKRTLKNNFIEDEDYKILLVRRDEQKNSDNRGGHNHETIMLNVDTFKNLCMMARTDKGKEIRKYYVKLENIYNKIIKEEIENKDKLLEEKQKQLQKQLQEKEKELVKYKEKIYEEIDKTGHIYVIKTDGGTKVGKTKDVAKRIKGLQTANNKEIEVLIDFKTSNPDLLEKTVHYILERYRCNSNREFFDCNVEFIKTVVEISGKVMDTLKSCYQQITKEQILNKLSENDININLELDNKEYQEKQVPKYEYDHDKIVKKFISDNIMIGDRNNYITKSQLRDIYREYYKQGK
jgi:phage anti-repressor protein